MLTTAPELAARPDPPGGATAALEGLAQGLGSSQSRRRGPDDARARVDLGQDLLLKLFESPDADVRRASLRGLTATGLPPDAAPLLARAAATAHDADRDPALRADSIGLLALGDPAAHEALFREAHRSATAGGRSGGRRARSGQSEGSRGRDVT